MEDIGSSIIPSEDFAVLSQLAYREAGLVLVESKSAMIQSRLRHRLGALGVSRIIEYCEIVDSDNGRSELPYMISALTTNVSGFFREKHHFEKLVQNWLPKAFDHLCDGGSIRIWSAGCSNGQEPYSLAMMLANYNPKILDLDCKVLATDIDLEVLRFAKLGVYDESQISSLSDVELGSFFTLGVDGLQNSYTVDDRLKSLVTFKQLNLHDPWPIKGKLDVIFCRNVVIYFDAETQTALWPRFHQALKPDGLVFVGHSERISHPKFQSVGTTTYAPVSN